MDYMDTYLLTLDTTTSVCSVGLARNGQTWILREHHSPNGHAQYSTLFVQEVLQTAGLSLSDLSGVVVSRGPGSYTGLRIGASTAKGLCYALDRPLVSVDTLQALAWAAQEGQQLLPPVPDTVYVGCLDARRMDAYIGLYDAELAPLTKPYFATLTPEHASEMMARYNAQRLVVAGDAAPKWLEQNIPFLEDSGIHTPSARYLSALGQQAWAAKAWEDVAYFEPFYLKQPYITRPKPKF